VSRMSMPCGPGTLLVLPPCLPRTIPAIPAAASAIVCVAVEKEEGSPAGLTLRFANQMADAIKSEFPTRRSHVRLPFTIKPPKITRPRAQRAGLLLPHP